MKTRIFTAWSISLLLICQVAFSSQFEALGDKFNRTTSRVMIRKVNRPTQANLDYAAYIANPVRTDPEKFVPKAPLKKVKPIDCVFGGLLSNQCGSLKSTPLTTTEKSNAMAWEPLQKKLWEIFKNDVFTKIGSAINSEKWADPSVFMPYQEVTTAYLHDTEGKTQIWVRIEFKPWVGFVDGMSDEYNDGFKAVYGRLAIDNIDKNIMDGAVSWIRTDYCGKVLTKAETIDWANNLASYWYPKFNTDIVDMTGLTQWPDDQTEDEIVKELKGFTVKNPAVVIRGNPLGSVLYNVFVVDLADDELRVEAAVKSAGTAPAKAYSTASVNFTDNNIRFAGEIEKNGDYAVWAKKNEAFRKELYDVVKAVPESQMGFKGRDDWVFFRKDIDFLNAGDLNSQPEKTNPFPPLVEFNKFLKKRNIDMLFVAVPDKAEVYFEKLPGKSPSDALTIINPYSRKFLKNMQDSGIEVIDLLPLFLSAKNDDAKYKEGIYQKQDTHWTDRGLEIAAQAIAARIKQFGWYGETSKDRVDYSVKDTFFERQGDIADKLAETDKALYPAVTLEAVQVYTPQGKLFTPSNPHAPILLMGDSFTGVFEIVDCKGAGVGAHIAEKTSLPVDIITSWGGGPLVREKMLRARQKNLSEKRVVVYMMVSRDLYNYSQGWSALEVK